MYYNQQQQPMHAAYGQQQYNQSLPFPIDRLLMAPIHMSPGQLHFQLNIQCHPNLTGFLQLIGTSGIDAIQAKCQDNQLRVFLFNKMSVNNYVNPEFMGFCKAICQYTEMMMAKGVFRDVQSAIFDGAVKVAEMYTAESLRQVPALQQMVDPNLIQRCQATLAAAAQFAQEFGQYQQQAQMQMNQPQQQYGYQPNQYQQPQYQQPNQYQQPQNTNSFYAPSTGGGQSPFSAPSQYQQPQQSAPVQTSTYLSSRNNQEIQQMPQPVQMQSPIPVAPVDTTVGIQVPDGILVKASETKWVPTAKYPFTICYDPTKYELYYIIEPDGAMKPFVKPLSKEESMEMNKHFKSDIAVLSNVSATSLGCDQRVKEFMDDLNSFGIPGAPTAKVKADPSGEEGILMETNIEVHKAVISDAEVWVENEIFLHTRKTKSLKNTAQMLLSYICSPLISDHDPKPLADKLLAISSFMEACNILKTEQAQIKLSPKVKSDTHILNFINERLTKRLNSFVEKELSLDITIDSFMDDALALIDHVEKKMGDVFSNPLRAYQQKIIQDAVYYVVGSCHDNLYEFYAQDTMRVATDDKPSVTFFAASDIFVSVNLFASDLKINLSQQKCSVAIFEEQSPLLYSIASHIYRIEDETDELFRRHLIRTLDNRVLEINRSKIDNNTLLVSVSE